MSNSNIFNTIELTQDEENCILFFLNDARGLAHLNNKEQWYPVIDTILQKYMIKKYSNITEAQQLRSLGDSSV